MAGEPHFVLGIGKRLPGSDPDLLFYQINPGHPFGHRMLYLDPGIHFHKIKVSIFLQKKFDGARIFIVRGLRRPDGSLSHFLS